MQFSLTFVLLGFATVLRASNALLWSRDTEPIDLICWLICWWNQFCLQMDSCLIDWFDTSI
jgi:hypothetical protein